MNHAEQPCRGRHAADSTPDAPISGDVLQRAEQLTTERLKHAHQKLGDALLAYLSLSDVDPSSAQLENDFYAVYRGDHATIDETLRAQLDNLGWADALHQMRLAHGIDEHLLVWDLDLIKTRMDEIYDFVEYNGRIYQFIK